MAGQWRLKVFEETTSGHRIYSQPGEAGLTTRWRLKDFKKTPHHHHIYSQPGFAGLTSSP